MPEDDQFIRRRDAPALRGVPLGTLRLWERAGRLHPIHPDGDRHTWYAVAELDEAVRRASEPALDWDALQDPFDFAPGGPHLEDLAPVPIEIEDAIPDEAGAAPEAAAADTKGGARPGRGSRPPAVLIRERLLKGSAWVLLGTALGSVLGTAVNGLIARLLTHGTDLSAVGGYFLAFSIAGIGGTLAQLGMERAVVRLVAASIGTGLPGRARRTVRIVFTCAAIGSLFLAALIVFGGGNFLAHHIYRKSALPATVMVFIAGWLIAAAFQSLFAETFRAFQRFWLATFFNGLLFDIFAFAVFGVMYLRHAHPSLAQAILITIAIMTAALLVASVLLWRRYSSLNGPGTITLSEVVEVAWPLLVFNLATFMVGTGIDLWVVGAFRGTKDVALYAAASKLVFYIATPFIIASQVVPPIIAELWAQGKKDQLERSLRDVATIAGVPAMLVLILFVFAGGPVMRLVYGKQFAAGAVFLAILSLARVMAVLTGNSGSALQMTGHQRTMMYITLFTGAISVTAEIIAIQTWGVIGVAYATAGAQILQNSLQLAYARRRLGIWTHAELSLRPFRGLIPGFSGKR
jgi:O-antigen/teichoic acid export membrane protein